MTVREALVESAERLRAAGCPDPEGDARLLLADALHPAGGALDEAGRAALAAATARRAAREPLAYIRGRTTFRGLEIAVDRRVLVPRAETELLVRAALAIPRGARVLEPCTGSGAVALALKHERPDLQVTASDISPDALAVARANAERLGIEIELVEADGIAGVPGGPFDAVVSNPPYVGEEERATGALPPELEQHEPPGAFWAGVGGLDLYRSFAGQLDGVAWAAFEVGDGQDAAVGELLERAGLGVVDRLRAASGHVRVVVGERS